MNEKKNGNVLRATKKYLSGNKAILLVIILAIALSLSTNTFLQKTNILNVLRQVCVSSIIAFGFTMILGAGLIDLSVGSILGLSGMILGLLTTEAGVNVWLAMLITIIFGAICGALNAGIITAFSLPAFIVTMATDQIFRGICYLITQMKPILNLPPIIKTIGQGYLLGIPIPIYITVAVMIAIYVIANYTSFGRYIIAMGSNKEAAFVSGINVTAVRFGVYALLGVCASIAGIVMTGRTASSQPAAGDGMSMDAIAAVVIGGTSMDGGTAYIINTVFGCLLIGMLSNGLNLLGVNSNWQIVMKGAIVLLAVIMDKLSARAAAKK